MINKKLSFENELQRKNKIMNDPIENLISKTENYISIEDIN